MGSTSVVKSIILRKIWPRGLKKCVRKPPSYADTGIMLKVRIIHFNSNCPTIAWLTCPIGRPNGHVFIVCPNGHVFIKW